MMMTKAFPGICACLALVACTSAPHFDDSDFKKEVWRGLDRAPRPVASTTASKPIQPIAESSAEVVRGTGDFIHPQPTTRPRSRAGGPDAVNFQFEDQPIEAVVQVILGDVLKRTYVIGAGVQGTVTFSTAEPVDRSQALPILDMLLQWTGNALVERDGRYTVMPIKEAYGSHLSPTVGPLPAAGLQARWFPLHYIAAPEMEKLLGPFARPEAVLQVDAQRNLLVLAGTREELTNYQRAIEAFDVNWLKGMSVALFKLRQSRAQDLTAQLEKVFGGQSGTPLAGLVRFIPIEHTNTLIVLSSQPDYLDEISHWIERIDHGGSEPQFYVYEARNIEAGVLAADLNAVYGDSTSARASGGEVGPGLRSQSLGSGEAGTSSSAATGPAAVADLSNAPGGSLPNGMRITASQSGNQLLIRSTPAQWSEMQSLLQRLDVTPFQVQVEMRILEVNLVGEFRFGVQWYLQGLADGDKSNPRQGALGRGGATSHPSDTLFYSFVNSNVQVALRAMESNGNTRVLSAPSVVVANKQAAHIQVGDRIPVTQNFIDTSGSGRNTVGTVQYQDTGVILDVTPRVNPGGLVYLDVAQQVSGVDTAGSSDAAGNPTIRQRQINTRAIIQSGQTVLLGGLIQQDDAHDQAGVPFLQRVPGLGRLFGTTSHQGKRTELVVLITPTILANSEDAHQITNGSL